MSKYYNNRKKNLIQQHYLKKTIVFLITILFIFISSCTNNNFNIIQEFNTYSISNLENNPDRGLRGESYIFLETNSSNINQQNNAQTSFDEEINKYPENIKIVQQYIYLIQYYNRELDSTAFDNLKKHFEHVREKGIRLLIRFAYENYQGITYGPTTSIIEMHSKQIKNWILENYTLFTDVVYSVQLGMIGAWGEGHSSANAINQKRVFIAVADMIPEPYTIMYRYYSMQNSIPLSIKNRFAIHEDWLVSKPDRYDHFQLFYSSKAEEVFNNAQYTINDGEMPWAGTWGYIEPLDFINSIYNYSLTTLSAAHHYMEHNTADIYNLQRYKNEYVTIPELIENNLPYFEEYFNDNKISVFDYIYYHLGYIITLDNIKESKGKTYITLSNHGLAAPVNFRLYYYHDEKKHEINYSLSNLIHNSTQTIELGKIDGIDGLIIESTINSNLTIGLGNNFIYKNGINYIK